MLSPRRIALSLLLVIAPLAAARAQAPVAPASAAPVDPAKAKSVRQLLDLTHVAAAMIQGLEISMQNQRQANPQIPAEFWDTFSKKAHESLPSLVDSLVPVYARHFSQAEIDQLIQFYSTPIGQHLVAEQQGIVAESSEMGRKWGMEMGRQIADSLQAAGGQ